MGSTAKKDCNMKDKVRADIALTQQGLVKSRQEAQSHIMAGVVYLKEEKVLKPSQMVPVDAALDIRKPLHPFVSRGGLKLEKAMEVFKINAGGKVAMDIGAATGGFTDVLLRSGAAHVYAVDVGYGQLDWGLRTNPKVTVMERTNARHLTKDDFPLAPVMTVMDVSFISIRLILPVAAQIMGEEGMFVTLIKPQFEAGKEFVGKKGVVRDGKIHQKVIEDIVLFVKETLNWHVTGLTFSPITGPEGNIEFLAKIEKQGIDVTKQGIEQVVLAAHGQLE